MKAEVLEEIVKLASEKVRAETTIDTTKLEAGGRTYIRTPSGWSEVSPIAEREVPLPPTYQLSTLNGLVDYLKSDIDGTKEAKAVVHVLSPTRVEVLAPVVGFKKQRPLYAVVSVKEDAHPFAQAQEMENFMVWLRSRFVPTTDSEALIRALSGVNAGEVKNVVDTGLTQEVSTKVGVDMTDRAEVKNPVMLQPYRTFREVEQPKSEFVVRLAGQKEGLPRVTLHEADGGTWKLEAILKTVEFLREKLGSDTVVIG